MTKLRPAALLCVLAALLCGSPCLRAQSSHITGIAHVAFRVSNLESERRFFRALGFEEAFVLTRNAQPYEVFVKINDRQFIELYPSTTSSEPPGWMHVCYESDDLHALYAADTARGLQLSRVVQAGAGNLLTVFHEPEGRVVEFTQYMPSSRHTRDRDLHLGSTRISSELVGIVMPTGNIDAAQHLYTDTLGFQPWPGTPQGRMRLGTGTDEWVALKPADADAQPVFYFRVASVKRAAHQLRQHGLHAARHGKLVSLQDPEGNRFVFVQEK
jgi:catechol 2,3-dioxygenase-like lactoylglutathione lyase family enzyme